MRILGESATEKDWRKKGLHGSLTGSSTKGLRSAISCEPNKICLLCARDVVIR